MKGTFDRRLPPPPPLPPFFPFLFIGFFYFCNESDPHFLFSKPWRGLPPFFSYPFFLRVLSNLPRPSSTFSMEIDPDLAADDTEAPFFPLPLPFSYVRSSPRGKEPWGLFSVFPCSLLAPCFFFYFSFFTPCA